MTTLKNAHLHLLDEVIGNLKIEQLRANCPDKTLSHQLSEILTYVRTHPNYPSDSRAYKVELSETITRVVTIEAESEEQALAKVKQQYEDGEITLDISDYLESNVAIVV